MGKELLLATPTSYYHCHHQPQHIHIPHLLSPSVQEAIFIREDMVIRELGKQVVSSQVKEITRIWSSQYE